MNTQESNEWLVSLDDFYQHYENNAMNFLWYLKDLYPTFKLTLFTIPNRLGKHIPGLLRQNSHWLQCAIHGWDHDLNEVEGWDEAKCNSVLDECEKTNLFVKGFKAPNWSINDAMLSVLQSRGYWVADNHSHHEYISKNFPKLKIHCVCNPKTFHGHTWDLNNPDPKFNNGIGQIIKENRLPFKESDYFKFIDTYINGKD